MKASELFRVTAMSALTEMQKMGQKFSITGETFDPFQGDAPGFTLKHQRPIEPADQSHENQGVPVPDARELVAGPDVVRAPAPHRVPAPHEPEIRPDAPQAPRPRPHARAALAGDLNARGMRRALILSEVLAPPLALRGRR